MKTCKYCETNYDEATNIDAMFPHDIELNSRFLFDLETCGVATIGILAYTTKLNVVVVIRDGFPNKRYVLGLYNIPSWYHSLPHPLCRLDHQSNRSRPGYRNS